jgi:hypothetical protein
VRLVIPAAVRIDVPQIFELLKEFHGEGTSDCSPQVVCAPSLQYKRENHNALKSLNSFRAGHEDFLL